MKKPLISDGYGQALSDIIDVLKAGLDDCSIDATEDSLLVRLRDYLLTTDKGLALVGQQYGMIVDNDDICIDLLFYHIPFQCYFVVELMPCSCSPKDASQLNYYLTIVDHMLNSPDEKPSIGLLVNRDGANITAKYIVQNGETYQNVFSCALIGDEELPEALKACLPSTEKIEHVLSEH